MVDLIVPQAAEQALTVQVTDSSDNVSAVVNLTGATGENGAISTPVDINAMGNRIAEDAQIGDSVGFTVKANDYETVSYSLVDDAGGLFTIDSQSGEVTLAATLDYETAQMHQITARASSTDGTLRDLSTNIDVLNVNDNDVSDITDGSDADNTVTADASIGASVGINAKAVDADGDDVTFLLLDNADGRFAINADTGILSVAGDLSDAVGTQTVTVAANSTDGTSAQADFSIDVTAVLQSRPSLFVDSESSLVDTHAGSSHIASPDISQLLSVEVLPPIL